MSRATTPLRLNSTRSGCVLPACTECFSVSLPAPDAAKQTLLVKLKRGAGDPLLMCRFGTEPPRVPRRAKVLADVWDQQSFDSDASEHVLRISLPPGGGPAMLGVHNYAAHRREPCHFTISVSTVSLIPSSIGPAATPRELPLMDRSQRQAERPVHGMAGKAAEVIEAIEAAESIDYSEVETYVQDSSHGRMQTLIIKAIESLRGTNET